MYNSTYWNNNDTPSISAANLNKMENGIANADKNAVPDITIFFNENGVPLASSSATAFSEGSFSAILGSNAPAVRTVFVARSVTELASGFSSGLNNLTTIYIDAPQGSIDVVAPENVSIIYGGDYKLAGGLWKNMISVYVKIKNLQNQIDNLPTGGVQLSGRVSFSYNGATSSIQGTGVTE